MYLQYKSVSMCREFTEDFCIYGTLVMLLQIGCVSSRLAAFAVSYYIQIP